MKSKKMSFCPAKAGDPPRKSAGERVFDTARALFYQRGVRAVGVDEIVTQAGVTKPSLYRAFASKDDLVTACLTASANEGRSDLDRVIAGAGSDPRDQLRAVIDYFAAKISDAAFRGCPMSNTAVEYPEPGHPGRAVLEQCKTDIRQRIAGITRRLGTRDPDALADGLTLIIEGAMANHHIFGSQGPSSAMIATSDALIDWHVEAARLTA